MLSNMFKLTFSEIDKILLFRAYLQINNQILLNILAAFIIKGGSLLVSFFSTPAYIRYFNNNNVLGFAPRENIRIKKAGGQNFVHGGVSLQEMVIPVIKYKYLRAGYKSYENHRDKYDAKPVTIALLSSNRKISNMIFNLSFYQKEPVKDNLVSCTYEVYIADASGNKVSDVQKIIADKESQVTKDREFKVTFNLKPQAYSNKDTYYLVIADSEGLQIPVKEEMQIDIAMAFEGLDLFKLGE